MNKSLNTTMQQPVQIQNFFHILLIHYHFNLVDSRLWFKHVAWVEQLPISKAKEIKLLLHLPHLTSPHLLFSEQ